MLIRILFTALLGNAAVAQTPSASEAAVQQLTAEIRQLRLILERSAVVTPRITVMLHRIELQQAEVQRISGQLEGIRMQLNAPSGFPDEAQIQVMEASVPAENRKLMQEQMKKQKERWEQEHERLRAQEVDLAGRLRTEQSKLQEMNDRLDALDRLLGDTTPAK